MYWMILLLSLSLLALIGTGIYLEIHPPARQPHIRRKWKSVVAINLLVFVGAQVGLLVLGMQDAMAETTASAGGGEVSVGLGLSLIGIGIPTALATIGAGIAVGPVGAASLAVISEKPELFGRTLIYLGLAEGIAIYGLVVTILMLGKIG